MIKRLLLLLMCCFCATAVLAEEAVPTDTDPVAQKRAMELSAKLRCLVCQNQSIAESDAELAVDLRRQVRTQIAAGKSDQEIIQYMTDRYGDFVLYSPPLKSITVLLWAGPILLLLLGLAALVLLLRYYSSGTNRKTEPLSEAERIRAQSLLEGRDE